MNRKLIFIGALFMTGQVIALDGGRALGTSSNKDFSGD